MRTGIEFFDEQEFKPGDVVVFGGFTCSGKTQLTTAIAAGLVNHTDSEILCVDLGSTHERWAERIDAYKLPEAARSRLRYRGMRSGAFSPEEFGKAAVVLDHMGLMAEKDALYEVARIAKLYAVRQKTVVVLGFQLSRELAGPLNTEGWVDPARLPEWVLEFGTQVYLVRSDTGGDHGPLRSVIRVKDHQLHTRPDKWAPLSLLDGVAVVGRHC